jgi:tetratricopeptide (TPR) repeat protein
MAIEGKLQDVGLADICQLLAMGRKSGCLSVTDRSNFGYIYFDSGRVVHATVLNRKERLGEYLVRHGSVPEEELARARADAAGGPGVHYAHLLVERGALSEEALERYWTIEVEEAVYHLFAWEEGSFHFATDKQPEEGVPLLVSLPAESLLLEGARRVDEWGQIEQVVTSFDTIFRIVEDPRDGEDADRTPQQEAVLAHLDGKRTVTAVVREAGMVEFEVARALYEMVREGWLEAAGSDGEGAEEQETDSPGERALTLGRAFYRTRMFDEAERELRACLAEDPACVEALDLLGLICLRDGRLDEALAALAAAASAGEPRFERHHNRALVLEKLGRLDEALEALDAAGALVEDRAPALSLARGIVLLKSLRPAEALAELRSHRASLGEGDDPGDLFFAHAILAAAMAGEQDEALRLGREGLTLHPWSGPILVNLGAVLERSGEAAAAEALFLRAVGESHTPAQAHRNLGDMALRRGDRAGARGHYERAVRLDPSLGDIVFVRLGNLFYEDGDHEVAGRLWSRALELNPENEVARTNLGLVAAGADS